MKKKDIISGSYFCIKDVDGIFLLEPGAMELKKKSGQYFDFHCNVTKITSYGFEVESKFLMLPIIVVVLFKYCKIYV